MPDFYSKIKRSLFLSVLFSALSCWALEITNVFLIALLLSSVFAFLSNLDFALISQKGKWSKTGPSLAHAGFAMLILGALIATGKSNVISQNTSGYDVSKLGKDFNNMEHIMLVKNDTVQMGDYFLTYKGKKIEGVNHYFNIDYFSKDPSGKLQHEFMLSPIVQTNPRMGNTAEPDTRHFLHKDVYTHIAYAELSTEDQHIDEGFPIKKDYTLQAGDTVFTSGAMLVLEGLIKEFDQSDLNLKQGDLAVAAKIKILTPNGKVSYAQPVFSIRENMIVPVDVINQEEEIKFSFTSIDPETGKINLLISEKDKKSKDFIILKAIIFPWINLLWMGCLLMVVGTAVAIVHRVKINNKQPA
jgi:cytochrome c-type biogenesis protein CcmF